MILAHGCVGARAQPLEIALLLTSNTRLAGFTWNGRGSLINSAQEVIKKIPQLTVKHFPQLPDRSVKSGGHQALLPGNEGQDKRKLAQIAPGEV